MVRNKKTRATLRKGSIYVLVLIACLVAIVPFLWMVSSSFKKSGEIFTYPPVWIPREPTVQGYTDLGAQDIFADVGFGQFVINSLFVALLTSFIVLILSSMAAYSMSRFRFRGSRLLKYTILLSQMLPGALLLMPIYLFFTDLKNSMNIKLLDTLWALVITYVSFGLPYNTYILKGYFDTIPVDLDEAAIIDGCSRIQALFRVVLPLAAPGLAATATQVFIMGWNEFMFALVFLNSYSKWTLPLALGSFRGQYLVDWGFLFYGSTLVTLPAIILFLLLQRWLATGFVAGAVKG
jgi:ABC-type glycerol-3-phosphate transport system permease component